MVSGWLVLGLKAAWSARSVVISATERSGRSRRGSLLPWTVWVGRIILLHGVRLFASECRTRWHQRGVQRWCGLQLAPEMESRVAVWLEIARIGALRMEGSCLGVTMAGGWGRQCPGRAEDSEVGGRLRQRLVASRAVLRGWDVAHGCCVPCCSLGSVWRRISKFAPPHISHR